MSGWEVGDLALCVMGGDEVVGMITGDAYVSPLGGRVFTINRVRDFHGILGLGSASWMGFLEASRFRKITPPAADEFDRETIALMNRAPNREKVNG